MDLGGRPKRARSWSRSRVASSLASRSAAGSFLSVYGREAGADVAQLILQRSAALLLKLSCFPLLGYDGGLEIFAALLQGRSGLPMVPDI